MLHPFRATTSASPSTEQSALGSSRHLQDRKTTEYSVCGGLGASGNGRTDHCSSVTPRRTGNKCSRVILRYTLGYISTKSASGGAVNTVPRTVRSFAISLTGGFSLMEN